MAGRAMDIGSKGALEQSIVYIAWIFRLDVLGDPVFVWTGTQDYAPVNTGDAALDGFVFEGQGAIGKIGDIVDGPSGSQAVKLSLSGISLDDPLLRQVVNNENVWQFRRAWIWVATLDENYQVVGKPFRVKTGRMDTMAVGKGRNGEYVTSTIESHQAYASQALDTKYSEQKDIDPTDTSQNYVHDLANRQAVFGPQVVAATTTTTTTNSQGSNNNQRDTRSVSF